MRRPRSNTWTRVLLMAGTLLMAPLAARTADSGETGQDRYAALVKVDGAFSETFVRPGADFSHFTKLYVWGSHFDYRDVGPAEKTRSSLRATRSREFGISDEDRARFEEIVSEAFRKELARADSFELITDVDDIDEHTLIARAGLTDIISTVPPQTVGRSRIYLSSVGAATFFLELMDAGTGEVLALVAQRRAIETLNARAGAVTVQANAASIWGDVRRWAADLARRLRRALDQAIESGAGR